MIRNKPRDADVYGVDIGKNIFHIVGVDAAGAPIQRVRCRRETLIQFFQRAAPALVGMEACPGSQWLARKIQSCGHTVKIVPAQFVKPYLKSNKNDTLDAEAIAEAVTRPTMRFVEVKAVEQIDTQALHRARDQMVMHGTRLISQMRAFASNTASRFARGPASSSWISLVCWGMRATIFPRPFVGCLPNSLKTVIGWKDALRR
jgi:transposase